MTTKRCQGCGKQTNLITGLGPVLLCTNECYPDAMIASEEARNEGESFDIRVWARRRYKRLHDNTGSERSNRRNEILNEKAKALGFNGLSELLTAWKNGDVEIVVEDNRTYDS